MLFLKDNCLSTERVTQELLGCLLIREEYGQVTSGWIVETEAYVGVKDEACHSYNGKNTPRLQAMYQEAGTSYVYQMHTHQLLNVVTKEAGNPQAVLIRAIEPFEGIELLEERRGRSGFEMTNGPGKLTQAMGVTHTDYETDIYQPPLFIDPMRKKEPRVIEKSKRIGIPNKGNWTNVLLRYTIKGNPFVSRRKGKIALDYGWQSDFN